MLFRARLPNIITLGMSRSPNSLRSLINQCRITGRQFLALILHSSANGIVGVEIVLEYLLVRTYARPPGHLWFYSAFQSHYMQGLPTDIQQWTRMTSRTHLRQILSNLSVPQSILQPYIVRKIDAVTLSSTESSQNERAENHGLPIEEVIYILLWISIALHVSFVFECNF